MAFTNVGSAEVETGAVTWNVATPMTMTAVAVPDLGAQRIGIAVLSFLPGFAYDIDLAAATWNGVAMTRAIYATNSAKSAIIYYLVGAADNGNYNIAFTYNHVVGGIVTSQLVAIWADANNAISLDDTSSETGTTGADGIADIVSTQATANELVISSSAAGNNSIDGVSGCTLLQSYDSGSNCMITAYSIPASSGDTTHTHDYLDAADPYAIVSASFKEAGGAEQKTATPSDNLMA